MKIVRIKRFESTDNGTFGKITIDGTKYIKFTGELPWNNNEPRISCIPVGEYLCIQAMYKGKPHYLLSNVANREGIFIHAINFVGDKKKGLKSDSMGCIGIGDDISYDEHKQKLIVGYDKCIREFHEAIIGYTDLDHNTWPPFKLIIS